MECKALQNGAQHRQLVLTRNGSGDTQRGELILYVGLVFGVLGVLRHGHDTVLDLLELAKVSFHTVEAGGCHHRSLVSEDLGSTIESDIVKA